MNTELQSALRFALSATQEINPADLEPGDLALWHAADRRCAEIIERLVLIDEAGPVARSILQRIAAM